MSPIINKKHQTPLLSSLFFNFKDGQLLLCEQNGGVSMTSMRTRVTALWTLRQHAARAATYSASSQTAAQVTDSLQHNSAPTNLTTCCGIRPHNSIQKNNKLLMRIRVRLQEFASQSLDHMQIDIRWITCAFAFTFTESLNR